jgi:hypothetical protein
MIVRLLVAKGSHNETIYTPLGIRIAGLAKIIDGLAYLIGGLWVQKKKNSRSISYAFTLWAAREKAKRELHP